MERYPHQIEAVKIAEREGDSALLWEMGTGKTLGLIDILRMRINSNKRMMRVLVLSPSVTLYNWREEILKFSAIKPELVTILDGVGKKREDKVTYACKKDGILILNYEGLLNERVFETILNWNPEIVIADESQYIKNYKAKRSKKVVALGDRAKYRYILSGTPILNDIGDIYMQFRFLDKGASFGKSFFIFRSVYMYDRNAGMPKYAYFPDWVPRQGTLELINQKIYKRSSRITKDLCLKHLPPMITTTRYVELGKDQKKAYEEMKKEFITFVKTNTVGKMEAVVAQLAMTKALRLMQITSGSVTTDSGATAVFTDNPRAVALKDILQEVAVEEKHKIIVWCTFKADYKIAAKICEDLKLEYTMLTGEQNAKEKQESMETFCKGSARVIIANRRAGGIGVNLVEAGYSCVYSRNFSLGEELQSEARNHRGGSEIHDKIIKINLCATGTIDEIVMKALQSKEDLADKILQIAKELA